MSQSVVSVLIVDDDEDMRATLTDFIARMGAKVSAVGTVAEAQWALRTEIPPFDLVLADLKLPEGNGLDVVRAARARSAQTLVTIVTGYASLETAIESIRLGAYDYITKPFTLDEIGVQVRNMMSRVCLSKENAHLANRLQELCAQVNRLQEERIEAQSTREAIRDELRAIHRKLDHLLADQKSGRLHLQP